MHLFDLDRDGTDRATMPAGPAGPASMGQLDRSSTPLDHERRRQRRHRPTIDVDRRRRRRRRVGRPPRGGAAGLADTLASVGRLLAPATQPLSDVMTGAVALGALRHPAGPARRPEGGGRGARAASSTTPSSPAWPAASAATTCATARSVRDAPHDDADQHPHRRAPPTSPATSSPRPGSRSRIDVDDPVERMRGIRELVSPGPGRAGARPRRAARRAPVPAADQGHHRRVRLDAARASTSSRPTCPGVPIPVFLAGARMEAQFAFGPMTRRGRQHHAAELPRRGPASAINSDPAAVADPERLRRVPPRRLRRGPQGRLATPRSERPAYASPPCVHADVAVVGGGPAGAAAAITLARAGRARRRRRQGHLPARQVLRRRPDHRRPPAPRGPRARPGGGARRGRRSTTSSWCRRPAARSPSRCPAGRGTYAAWPAGSISTPRSSTWPGPPASRSLDGHAVDRARAGRRRRHPRGRRASARSRASLRRRRRRDVVAGPQAGRRRASPATSASGTPSASTSTGVGPRAATELFVWFEPDLLPGYAWSFPLADGTGPTSASASPATAARSSGSRT